MKKSLLLILVLLFVLTGVITYNTNILASSEETEVTNIKFFHTFWVPSMLEILEVAIARYENENPGIKIQETRVSWTDAASQLMTSIMGGVAPDIVIANPSTVARFRAIGAFADITDLIPEKIKNSFVPAAMDIMTNQDGRIDGIAGEGCTWALFYRKDLFEEAGLDPNDPPETWEELVEYAQALTKDTDGDGKIDQWGYGWPVQAENATDYWENFLWQAGSDIVSFEDGNWKSKLAEEESIKGTQFMVDLVQKYKVSPVGLVDMNWEDVTNGFVFGNFAMMHNGAWVTGSVQSKGPELEGKWGTVPLYAGPAGRANRGHPNTFHILEVSNLKEQAWDFLEFTYTEGRKGELSYMEEMCELVASMLWTDHYIEYARETYGELGQPFIESYKSAKIPPMAGSWQTLCDMFGDIAIQELLMGERDVEETLKDLDNRFNKLQGN